MSAYTAEVIPAEDAWMVRVPEVDRVTQALHLREVETMARDLVHIMTGERVDDITLDIVWPPDMAEVVAAVTTTKRAAEKAERDRDSAARKAARYLKDRGASVRDIGAVLGISFQRAHQLLG